mgnify:FL=1
MAVNGIEIEVGQVWRTRGGECLRVENRLGHESPWVHHGYEFLLQDQTAVSSFGRYWPHRESENDLVELVQVNLVGSLRDDLADYEQAEAEKAKVDGLAAAHAEQSANATQVGGDHYKTQVIQPWDFIASNGIGFLAGNVVKYVARYKAKNGMEDLKKARHYLDKLIETEQAK